MNADTDNSTAQPATRRFDALHVSLLVLVAVLLTGIAAVWIVRTYIFPNEFKPVTLSVKPTHWKSSMTLLPVLMSPATWKIC